MLTIRLQRTGTKNKASFRIVLAQAYRSASKQALEVLGHYNPRNKEFGIKNQERLEHWLAKKVNISPTVRNLLIEKKLLTGPKVKAWKPKKSASSASAESSGGEKAVEATAAAPADVEKAA